VIASKLGLLKRGLSCWEKMHLKTVSSVTLQAGTRSQFRFSEFV
jgi:hypothetical protein